MICTLAEARVGAMRCSAVRCGAMRCNALSAVNGVAEFYFPLSFRFRLSHFARRSHLAAAEKTTRDMIVASHRIASHCIATTRVCHAPIDNP